MNPSRPSAISHLIDQDDATLIERVVSADDRVAFRILVDRHQGAVRAVLKRLSRSDEATAFDLAQATFLRAYLTLDQFRGGAQLRTWLYRIACNEYFQYRRLVRHQREVSVEDEGFEMQASEATDAEQRDRALDVERALATLNSAEQEAIVLCFYASLSHQEAADALSCPVGTLKSNIARGKVKLQQALAAWALPQTESAA